ncbi:DUF3817 domain-containing protein [Chengkuizengella axinellae]|uniref:DUF3817 domain-containing protein n=1 Tax=Chengkuizengella axinellae TaxID=3064388 RepID=A0ABT9IUJ4_9BACL|nr:DUF3817 domain-containing protein [Chengkuizengella sp. 2205SS18-9]MDP5273006.1 DUF3817 domain-containing protein [Chengkuizengella sp. 2205SS18-9]
MSKSIQFFRYIGFAEGLSFLILLFIAMPLKYIFDIPTAVSIVGSIHGGLFILFIITILYVATEHKWPFSKALLAAISSIVPFGPFLFDARILRKG